MRPVGWENGDPVTCPKSDGTVLAIGKVVVRKNMTTGKPYLKVQLQTVGTGMGRIGDWVWPEGWIIGQGPRAGICYDCGQEFRTAEADPSGACPPCDRRVAREHAADSGIRSPRAYMHGARTPLTRTAPASDDDIAALKARDEQESIF